ncbi:hypothetical protein VDGD_20698 [Verticillium dahliae]|nr:hypothetical protein VDGD_20698 [Verticillium dahliae]
MSSAPNGTDNHGRVAIITGGASGMGLAVTQRLSAQGWVVAILDFNEKAGQEAASSIPNTVFLQTDVSS